MFTSYQAKTNNQWGQANLWNIIVNKKDQGIQELKNKCKPEKRNLFLQWSKQTKIKLIQKIKIYKYTYENIVKWIFKFIVYVITFNPYVIISQKHIFLTVL